MGLCFLSLRDRTLVGSAILCLILKLSCGLFRRHTVLYFLPKTPHLLPTKYKIRPLVVRQNGANIHWSVPTSLHYLPTNLYTSVVDLIYVRRPMESPLQSVNNTSENTVQWKDKKHWSAEQLNRSRRSARGMGPLWILEPFWRKTNLFYKHNNFNIAISIGRPHDILVGEDSTMERWKT